MSTHSWDVLAELSTAVPERVGVLAERFAAGGAASAPVPATSVVLVRDGAKGIEAYLLHRHARMPFAASMVVFPGGRVDPVDLDDGAPAPETTGTEATFEDAETADSASVTEAGASVGPTATGTTDAAFRRCGVRETREETGVVLSPADLLPWAHWVTPELEPRRYDTYFYVAALPAGAEAADISGETDSATWMTAGDAVAAGDRGEIGLMPPTRSILLELAAAQTVAALQSAGADRIIDPVTPQIESADDGWRFVYPRRER